MANNACSLEEAWGTLLPTQQEQNNNTKPSEKKETPKEEPNNQFTEKQYREMIEKQQHMINHLNQQISEEHRNDKYRISNNIDKHVVMSGEMEQLNLDGIPKNRLVLMGCGIFLLYIFNSLRKRN